MTNETWTIGETATLTFNTVDETTLPTTAVDPATVVFRVRAPSNRGKALAYTYGAGGSPVVRDAAGIFHLDLVVTEPGAWHVRAESTGPAHARELTLEVQPSGVLP
jgi:hypothetical protein